MRCIKPTFPAICETPAASRIVAMMGAVLLLGVYVPFQAVYACPFCVPVQQTFSEEMDASDAVVIAELVHAPAAETSGDGKLEKSKFKIAEIIKGETYLASEETIELLYYGQGKVGDRFLIMGVDPPQLAWSSPTLLTDESEKYVQAVTTLPPEGSERLAFFQNYLEHENEMLARDAYDEFARAPYQDVLDLKDKMNHDQLVAWIKNSDIPASRRRLYLTMLGVCGNRADADMLEGMLRSDERNLKSGLDAMIACYLRLRGAEGLPLIEELYLKNKDAEYADTYSAIMALRFHGEEADVIPKKRITQSMHHMLDRPELADLVIVDLARWEDWSVMDRLVELFKNADEKSSWVRVPVVRYLMACPKEEAKECLKELEKIDEGAVRRAKTFFPFEEKEEETKTSAIGQPSDTTVAAKPTADPSGASGDPVAAIDGRSQPKTHAAAMQTSHSAGQTSHSAGPTSRSVATGSHARDYSEADYSNLYTTGGVLVAMAAIAAGYGAYQHFTRPQTRVS